MTYVIGVDPGLDGAFAMYDTATQKLQITDMPTWTVKTNKKWRQRVDPILVLEYFEMAKLLGVQLVVIEAVGGRPQQANGFTFGYAVGLVYMACIAARIPIETIPAASWKKIMRVPGKTTDVKGDGILARACELFPDQRELFYGKNGGKDLDRAEAAMIAKYAADYALTVTHEDLIGQP